MKKFILFISVILMASQSLLSQWVWQNPLPHGNTYKNIKFINSNTGFVVGDFGQFYMTSNQGTNWIKIYLPTFSKINTVYFRNSYTGWVCADSALLFKTTNGGLNWIQKTTGFYGSFKDIYFTNDSTGILSTAGYPSYYLYGNPSYILKTTNSGESWQSIYTLTNYNNFSSINFLNDNTGYIVFTTWNQILPNTPLTLIKYLATTNGGLNWTENYVDNVQWSFRLSNAIVFNNINTGFVAGDFYKIIRTSNAGINWSSQPLNIYSLSFVNQNLGYGTGDRIFKTTNSGLNWVGIDSTLPVYHYTSVFLDSTHGWIAGQGGSIIRTTNAGASFQDQTFGTKQSINGICFSGELTGYSCGNKGVFMKTTNAGNNWVTININTFASKNLTCISFLNNNTGWVGCDSAVFKTIDGGLTWSRKNIPVSNINDRINKIVFTNPGIGFAIINNTGKLYKSTDFGESWTLNYSLPNSGVDISFITPNTWLIMSKYNILKSTDNGANWVNSYTCYANQTIMSGYFINEYTGWVDFQLIGGNPPSAYYYIYKTTNGGINWVVSIGSLSQKIYFHNLSEGINIDGINIMSTTNGGSSWFSNEHRGNKILNLSANGKDLYLVGEYGMIMRGVNSFTTSANGISTQIPERYALYQNYPNPFNPTTKIKFDVVKSGNVKILVYDILGREVQTLVNENLQPGTYETTFAGTGLTSGIYFFRMTVRHGGSSTDGYSETKKMIYLK